MNLWRTSCGRVCSIRTGSRRLIRRRIRTIRGELSGFLPWAITEKLPKTAVEFSDTLNALETHGGTPAEIADAKADVIYVMGFMGHFVGDASQPLHTTMHHHGWVGNNPNNYTTAASFHSWIDGGFYHKTGGIDVKKLTEKNPSGADDRRSRGAGRGFSLRQWISSWPRTRWWNRYTSWKRTISSRRTATPTEGRAFLDAQIVKSGQFLGDLWYTAWATAPEDTYLERDLQNRAAAAQTK